MTRKESQMVEVLEKKKRLRPNSIVISKCNLYRNWLVDLGKGGKRERRRPSDEKEKTK